MNAELFVEAGDIDREIESRRRQSMLDRWEETVPASLRPLLAPGMRYRGAFGGRGGAKSHFFAEMLVVRCLERVTRAVCVREIQRSLEQSVKRLIEDKIEAFGVSDRFRILNTHVETPGGGIVIFQGMQDHTAESLKSLEGYDVAWVEEAQSLSRRSLDLLRPTIRKEGSEIWFSWNPQFATDPVDALFRGGDSPPGTVCSRTGWEDNPHLPEAFLREIEWDRRRDADRYAHVWEGAYRTISEARVFRRWRVEEFEAPRDAAFMLGGDWGFSSDPTVLVRSFLRGERGLCVDHEAYEVGCELDDIPHLFDSLLCAGACPTPRSSCRRPEHGAARRYRIVADSSRPDTISYLRRHGYPLVEASVKGKNSVEDGVAYLQSLDLVVHPRCARTIDELTFYSYKTDQQSGKILPVLLDANNHVIDSLRYATESVRRDVAAGLVF